MKEKGQSQKAKTTHANWQGIFTPLTSLDLTAVPKGKLRRGRVKPLEVRAIVSNYDHTL
jgi:hypothetical protein